jgi:hypothetical protein
VIASEAVPTTIGPYADCGRFGDSLVEGDAQVAYTIFVQPLSASQTAVQVNTRMRTELRAGERQAWLARLPLPAPPPGGGEANLLGHVRALLRP